jgi:hypothetical protein
MSVLRRASLTAAVVIATIYAIPANTSNPFVLNDGLFLFAVLWGIIRGNADAVLNEQQVTDKPSA